MNLNCNVFSQDSIAMVQLQLEHYRDVTLEKKSDQFLRKLAKFGQQAAQTMFDAAVYDGKREAKVSVKRIEKNSYEVRANGHEVCFIEFGAGVHFNGKGVPYPGKKPQGIVGIGEYGKGNGKRQFWHFKGPDGTVEVSFGNAAEMPMWRASKQMREQIAVIAQSMFGGDSE